MTKLLRNTVLALGALALLAGTALPTAPANAADKIKIYASAGFEGNTWMDASLNLLRAIAKTEAYKDRVELDVQSARGNAQTQIQQINAMVQAGADVIVSWAISPTALNRAIRCKAPVLCTTSR
jgi:ribose transport system substrate-binding protein